MDDKKALAIEAKRLLNKIEKVVPEGAEKDLAIESVKAGLEKAIEAIEKKEAKEKRKSSKKPATKKKTPTKSKC